MAVTNNIFYKLWVYIFLPLIISACYGGGGDTTSARSDRPVAPSDLTTSALLSSEIKLMLADRSNNENGFRIERTNSASLPYISVGAATAGATTFNDRTVLAPSRCYYRVFAFNTAGDSLSSNIISATTPVSATIVPIANANLTATAQSSSTIQLIWDDLSDNETEFKIYRLLPNSGGYIFYQEVSADITTCTIVVSRI